MASTGSTQTGEIVDLSIEELYEDAPCGYLSLLADGTVVKVNRTLLSSTGYASEQLLGMRLDALLTTSSRLYYATHWRPRLDLEGAVREVPADIVRADGTRLSVPERSVSSKMQRATSSVPRASAPSACSHSAQRSPTRSPRPMWRPRCCVSSCTCWMHIRARW